MGKVNSSVHLKRPRDFTSMACGQSPWTKEMSRSLAVRHTSETYQRHGYRWRRLHFCNIIVFYICFNALHGEVRRCNVCNWMQLSSNGVWWMALASQLVSCCQDYVAGIEAAPLPSASEYDCPCALLYTAEQDFATSHFVCMRETHWDSIVLTCFDWLQTDFWFMFENRVPPVPVAILGVSWQVSPILSAQTITNHVSQVLQKASLGSSNQMWIFGAWKFGIWLPIATQIPQATLPRWNFLEVLELQREALQGWSQPIPRQAKALYRQIRK